MWLSAQRIRKDFSSIGDGGTRPLWKSDLAPTLNTTFHIMEIIWRNHFMELFDGSILKY